LSFFYHPGCNTVQPIITRTDLASRVASDDWNSLAIRMDGPNFWVFLNNELLISLSESTADRGTVAFRIQRTGPPDDAAEVAVVLGTLRVSRLSRSPAPSDAPGVE